MEVYIYEIGLLLVVVAVSIILFYVIEFLWYLIIRPRL